MTEYWKDHFNANALKFPDSPLKQIEATVYGREVDQSQLDMMVDAIANNLALQDTDCVADLCCGNGIITKAVAQRCKRVDGVDFSANLIDAARAGHAANNIEYSVSDVANLPDAFFTQANKGYMCYAVQHLDEATVGELLRQIAGHRTWTAFFVSGIPDKARLNAFYDNDEKMAFYKMKEASGEPHLGKWWSRTELESLASSAGLGIQFLPQAEALFTSHYRFDCIIRRRQ